MIDFITDTGLAFTLPFLAVIVLAIAWAVFGGEKGGEESIALCSECDKLWLDNVEWEWPS